MHTYHFKAPYVLYYVQFKILQVFSTVPPPPLMDQRPVIAAEGENITLSCPLQTAPGLERFYSIAWRYPDPPRDITIVSSGMDSEQPWASLNEDTLALTLDPYNSSILPSTFRCVSRSFGRSNAAKLNIAQATVGTVQVVTASKSQTCCTLLHVHTAPMMIHIQINVYILA